VGFLLRLYGHGSVRALTNAHTFVNERFCLLCRDILPDHKRWNHLTAELFQRQGFFNGRDLWCGSFKGKNLSTVRNFNSKDFNGMDLQRQGLLNGRDLRSGSFIGGDLSSVEMDAYTFMICYRLERFSMVSISRPFDGGHKDFRDGNCWTLVIKALMRKFGSFRNAYG